MNEDMIHSSTMGQRSLLNHPLAKTYLSKVYAWMAVSMMVTAGLAIYSTHDEDLFLWITEHVLAVALGSLGIILLMVLCSRLLTAGAMGVLLLAFAAAEGLLFGPILTLYTQESLGLTFACTAGTFGVMALYGIYTKRDLSPWGRALFMILLGLIICSVVNLFIGSSSFDFICSIAGVVIFSLLTAYDTQKILQEGLVLEGDARSKGAILGALALYLDFINIFLYLLRFLGDRK